MKIGIIGGGIAGLTAAYELSKAGHHITLFEKAAHLGGQVATFEVGGEAIEGFYHHIFTNDTDIVQLIEELGLSQDLRWLSSKVGFYYGGKIYKFVSPIDLLRFTPIPLIDRLRLGLVGLYLRRYRQWQRLEATTAEEWITKYAGPRNYQVVWGPLLRGKFGNRYRDVGMVWFWGKIHLRFASRSGVGQSELLGYITGSFGRVIKALADRVTQTGGIVHTSTPVHRILTEGVRAVALEVNSSIYSFDAIIATVPSPNFLAMAPDLPEDYRAKLEKASYQAAVCLVLVLNRSLSPIYWLNISDPSLPFVAAIEHTNFISSSQYGDKHILYLSNYLSSDSPLYSLDAQGLLQQYLPNLKKINPNFDPSWVEEYHLFRDEAGQPIITTHYSQQIPEYQTPIPSLFLANTTQIYPEDRGMNYSVRLGRIISRLVTKFQVKSQGNEGT